MVNNQEYKFLTISCVTLNPEIPLNIIYSFSLQGQKQLTLKEGKSHIFIIYYYFSISYDPDMNLIYQPRSP